MHASCAMDRAVPGHADRSAGDRPCLAKPCLCCWIPGGIQLRCDLIWQLTHTEGDVMRSIAILLVVSLTGCGAMVNHTRTASGRDGAIISCGGLLRTWHDCDKAAANACSSGYDVVDRQEKKTYTDSGSFVTRKLVVSCRP
jgi:uncharacterized protein YceK